MDNIRAASLPALPVGLERGCRAGCFVGLASLGATLVDPSDDGRCWLEIGLSHLPRGLSVCSSGRLFWRRGVRNDHSPPCHTSRNCGSSIMARRCQGHERDPRGQMIPCRFEVTHRAQVASVGVAEVRAVPAVLIVE